MDSVFFSSYTMNKGFQDVSKSSNNISLSYIYISFLPFTGILFKITVFMLSYFELILKFQNNSSLSFFTYLYTQIHTVQ
jgi:hypothetical protein